MASVNKVIIMGNLGKDPELRYTQNQVPLCNITVATTDYRAGSDGERHTEWHRVVVWNKAAENVSKYLKKGNGVYIEGRLRTRSWDDQQGQKRYSTEIVAHNVQFLPRSHSPSPDGHAPSPTDQQVDYGGGFPGAYAAPAAPASQSPSAASMEAPQLPVIEDDDSSVGDNNAAASSGNSSQDFGALPF